VNNIRLHLIIEGRVQGVWFRDSTRREAVSLRVTGWIRNLPDRSVEVVAEGPEGNVEALAAWCQHGPPGAKVTRTARTLEEWKGEFSTFEIVF